MKFDTGDVDASTVTAAILTLRVSSAGGGNNQFLVLGLPGTCSKSDGRERIEGSADGVVSVVDR